MNPVHLIRQHAALTQRELALAAGTSQPTIAAYEAELKSPTFRTLQRLADASGVVMDVRIHSALTREDRRSLALHSAIAERLREDPESTLALARSNLARMREQHPAAIKLLREWSVLLDRPLSALVPVLTDPAEWARELRHVTPFAGVLSPHERAAVYQDFAEREDARPLLPVPFTLPEQLDDALTSVARDGPADLSTNPKHLSGYGK